MLLYSAFTAIALLGGSPSLILQSHVAVIPAPVNSGTLPEILTIPFIWLTRVCFCHQSPVFFFRVPVIKYWTSKWISSTSGYYFQHSFRLTLNLCWYVFKSIHILLYCQALFVRNHHCMKPKVNYPSLIPLNGQQHWKQACLSHGLCTVEIFGLFSVIVSRASSSTSECRT